MDPAHTAWPLISQPSGDAGEPDLVVPLRAATRRYLIHGPAVEIACDVPGVSPLIEEFLGAFADDRWHFGYDGSPPPPAATFGCIRPYDEAEVLRGISPNAKRVVLPAPAPGFAELSEIYEDGERYWIVDDRWGMAEINLLRGQWHSWLLPQPRVDPVRLIELAVLWPMAQLLRGRGVHLLPAASAVRDGWAVLILCPHEIEPELTALVRAGYRVIGQRWTAVREEEGRLALLHMPGRVERPQGPRFGGDDADEADDAAALADADPFGPGWTDFAQTHRHSRQAHAFCDAVVVTASGRRGAAEANDLTPATATAALRRAWPLVELHPARRQSPLAARFARHCRCAEVQLSRDPRAFPDLLDSLRQSPFGLEAKGDGMEEFVEDIEQAA